MCHMIGGPVSPCPVLPRKSLRFDPVVPMENKIEQPLRKVSGSINDLLTETNLILCEDLNIYRYIIYTGSVVPMTYLLALLDQSLNISKFCNCNKNVHLSRCTKMKMNNSFSFTILRPRPRSNNVRSFHKIGIIWKALKIVSYRFQSIHGAHTRQINRATQLSYWPLMMYIQEYHNIFFRKNGITKR